MLTLMDIHKTFGNVRFLNGVNLRFGKRVQRVYETLPLLATLRKRTPFHMNGGERQLLAFGNAFIIGKHINNVFSEGELERKVVVAKFAITTRCDCREWRWA